ncbi:MAG: hypothetical protein IKO68_10255 [Oscillospiraceae bacterium]|nr:hypothetical protein [Oscillospiraceae bacterium]
MAAYATVADVQARMSRAMSEAEQAVCETLLEDAAVIIDAYNAAASADAKRVVSCRTVIRAMGDGTSGGIPLGASQGSMTALGYTQSWTMGAGGAAGEMYLGRLDKKLLGVGDRIGSYSPAEELCTSES